MLNDLIPKIPEAIVKVWLSDLDGNWRSSDNWKIKYLDLLRDVK